MRWPAERDREFTEFVAAQRAALLRVAALLVSGDLARAEDVVQRALTRLYLAWPRVRPRTAGAYARRCVVNAATDDHRSLFSRREQVRAELPDAAAAEVQHGDATTVASLLAALPASMRAAVVLRYVEGLSVAEAAHAMGCSEGNAKSQSARGLERLRGAFPDHARNTSWPRSDSTVRRSIDMQDVLNELRSLPRVVTPGQAGAGVIAADVARGHIALSRRRRRMAFSGAAVAVVAGVAVAAGQPAGLGGSARPAAAGTGATAQASRVQLVAYTGAQPAGFRVSTVPAGWQVVSSDRYDFVVAPPGASTAPSKKNGGQSVSLAGRIAVMLQGDSHLPGRSPVTKVAIHGKEGQLGLAESGRGSARYLWLIFPDAAGHKVLVQLPASLGLTNAQIVRFAQGITVTSHVKTTHG